MHAYAPSFPKIFKTQEVTLLSIELHLSGKRKKDLGFELSGETEK